MYYLASAVVVFFFFNRYFIAFASHLLYVVIPEVEICHSVCVSKHSRE